MSQVETSRGMGNGVEIDRENNTVVATRKLRESGNSVVLTLPRGVVQGAGLVVGDEVELSADMISGEITLRKVESGPDESEDESEASG